MYEIENSFMRYHSVYWIRVITCKCVSVILSLCGIMFMSFDINSILSDVFIDVPFLRGSINRLGQR